MLTRQSSIGQLADQDKVEYTVTMGQAQSEKKRLTCKINVGERDIVTVGDGLSRMEVETRAADEACKILRREGRRLGKGRTQTVDEEIEDEGDEEDEEDAAGREEMAEDEEIERGR